ncbi:MAG: adaptor protein MecA [Oscillospiraceae bacterium]
MTTQLISNDAVAVLLGSGEVNDPELARELVRDLLNREGLTPWEDMEIEIFSNGESTLLMARRSNFRREGYRFANFEALIGAAITCRSPLPSRLISYGGEYYLLIRRPENEPLPELCEFSLEEGLSESLLSHIDEHGKVLIAKGAIDQLKNIFA